MKRAIGLFLSITLILFVIDGAHSFQMSYAVAYGAISMMAAIIAVTFFWLWHRRETPLALGMAFSWAGAASVLGWWWLYAVLDRPEVMVSNPVLFVFLALYCTGAILHFVVMQRSMGLPYMTFTGPVLLAVAAAAILTLGN